MPSGPRTDTTLADFQADVHKGQFPLAEHSFTMKEDEYQAFLKKLDNS